MHAEQDAAMHRLQAVANVGQRAADDHAHRVIEIRARISSSILMGIRFLLSPSPPPSGNCEGGVWGGSWSGKLAPN